MNAGAGKTVLIMAGGTGGHIFPALSIADYLQERGYHIEFGGGNLIERSAFVMIDWRF